MYVGIELSRDSPRNGLENKDRFYYGSSKQVNKVVMINFDDGLKNQLIYAKPILDKYGFKASFFIICGRIETESSSMNW